MPDSISSLGVLIEPVARITSRRARACMVDPVAADLHADGTALLDQHAAHVDADLDPQVRPLQRRVQERPRGGAAPPVADVEIVEPEAVLRRTVEIVVERIAGLVAGAQEHVRQRVDLGQLVDRQPAVGAVIVGVAMLVALGALEIGEHVGIAPALVAELSPVVEVGPVATDILRAVEHERAADRLAARQEDAAPAQARLRLGIEEPVVAALLEQRRRQHRQIVDRVAAAAAGFEQQDRVPAVGAQALGQHAAGRARTHHNEVVITETGRHVHLQSKKNDPAAHGRTKSLPRVYLDPCCNAAADVVECRLSVRGAHYGAAAKG